MSSNELEGMWKEQLLVQLQVLPYIFQKGQRSTMNILRRNDSRYTIIMAFLAMKYLCKCC